MNLAQTWVQVYTSQGLGLEEARTEALRRLNNALKTDHTRGDLWRWEAGAGMRPDRREFMVCEVVPYINKTKNLRLSKKQVDELIEAVL